MVLNIRKLTMFTATIVAPTGVPSRIDINIPNAAQKTDTITEHIVTALKFLKTRIEQRAGNIISAEIKSAPTKFMATTMTIAIITARKRL